LFRRATVQSKSIVPHLLADLFEFSVAQIVKQKRTLGVGDSE